MGEILISKAITAVFERQLRVGGGMLLSGKKAAELAEDIVLKGRRRCSGD